jgi:NTE family protein
VQVVVIHGVFTPYKYGEIELVDGGIRENTPWKETRKMGADKVISVVFEKELDDTCCENLIQVVENSLDIMGHELSEYELAGADYLIKIKTDNVSLLDVTKIDELYEEGYKQGKVAIKKLFNL